MLPKSICVECLKKAEEFHTFYQSVQIAQEQYLRQIVKNEVVNEIEHHSLEIAEQPDFVEVMTNFDMLDDFIDEEKDTNEIVKEQKSPPHLEEITLNDPPIEKQFDLSEVDEKQSGMVILLDFISIQIGLSCSF